MKRRARRKAPARTERPGMGNLISLKVELEDGSKRTWNFRERPVLSFDYVSEDASGRGRQAKLYVDCGSYRITDAGRCVVARSGKPRTVATSSVAKRRLDEYRRTHGGLDPREALVCPVRVAGRKRFVGWCTQINYRSDKKKHGRVEYFHPIARHCQPEVHVNEAGTQIYFRGGRLTVTPHGIEDLD